MKSQRKPTRKQPEPAVLTLRLKSRYWHQIASGEKSVELRLQTTYWRRRLVGRHYDEIHLWCGYPKRSETHKCLRRRWTSAWSGQVVHEEFGRKPVAVFLIDVSQKV